MKNYQKTEAGLRSRYNGPFKILERVSEVDFKLDLPARYRAYHPVFHASKLTVYTTPLIPGQESKPSLPVIIDDKEEWEVKRILQHRKRGKKTQYLVCWKGFGQEEDTWETENNLKNIKGKLKEYKSLSYAVVKSIEEDTINIEIELLRQ